MKTIQRSLLSCLAVSFAVACGPGREAAWEKESAQKTTQPAAASGASGPSGAEAAPADDLTQADDHWSKRESRADLEEAIKLWEKVIADKGPNADVLVKIARGYYLLGDGYLRLAGEEEAMLAALEKGTLAGEQAMMAVSQPFAEKMKAGAKVEEAVQLIGAEGQAAIYWYAANLGKFANAKGFTTKLFYKDRLFAVNTRVLSLGETFFHAAPHRFFGAFYAAAPSFAGGDLSKSKTHFQKAMELEPNYFGTKVLFAEFYATKAEDKELFKKLLTEVQSGDPTALADIVPEQKLEQTKAKVLLEKIDDLF